MNQIDKKLVENCNKSCFEQNRKSEIISFSEDETSLRNILFSTSNEIQTHLLSSNSGSSSLSYSSSSASSTSAPILRKTSNLIYHKENLNLSTYNVNEQNILDKQLIKINFSNTTHLVNNEKTQEKKETQKQDLFVDTNSYNFKSNPFIQQDLKRLNLYKAAKEIYDSEKTYVDALSLICVHYKEAVKFSINSILLNKLLLPFEILLQLNTVLLTRFERCIQNWKKEPKIAYVLVELGPFLKHYGDFVTKFEQINLNFSDMKKKYPAFKESTEHFEKKPICNKLSISHYMIKPIQRIAQYKLLIEKYIKYLKNDPLNIDYKNAYKALKVVTDAAEYSNEKMRENENFNQLLAIQQCIVGCYEIIKPYRRLIKKAVMFKISRKEKQERLFLLCSDCFIYLTIIKENSYKVNHEISLTGMRVSSPKQEAFENEILIRSSQRSIRVIANSLAQKEEWIDSLEKQVLAFNRRRSTIQSSDILLNIERPNLLGLEAPIWVPDSRVTMCQICTCEFTFTNRRHHCRACGQVICSKCSAQKYYLSYLKSKHRVCDNCIDWLTKNSIPEEESNLSENKFLSTSDPTLNKSNQNIEEEDNLNSLPNFDQNMKRNSRSLRLKKNSYLALKNKKDLNKPLEKQIKNEENINEENEEQLSNENLSKLNLRQSCRKKIPKVLTEVSANDKECDISGYLLKYKSKKNWKKYWFVVKNNVLYSFKQSEDVVATHSMPILGFTVQKGKIIIDGQENDLVLKLVHKNQPDVIFKLSSEKSLEKWYEAFETATKV